MEVKHKLIWDFLPDKGKGIDFSKSEFLLKKQKFLDKLIIGKLYTFFEQTDLKEFFYYNDHNHDDTFDKIFYNYVYKDEYYTTKYHKHMPDITTMYIGYAQKNDIKVPKFLYNNKIIVYPGMPEKVYLVL